jgi:hypothetical protein
MMGPLDKYVGARETLRRSGLRCYLANLMLDGWAITNCRDVGLATSGGF